MAIPKKSDLRSAIANRLFLGTSFKIESSFGDASDNFLVNYLIVSYMLD